MSCEALLSFEVLVTSTVVWPTLKCGLSHNAHASCLSPLYLWTIDHPLSQYNPNWAKRKKKAEEAQGGASETEKQEGRQRREGRQEKKRFPIRLLPMQLE